MFKLSYHVSNNGDGSVSVHFHPSAKAANEADAAMDEGWGESSADSVNLKVEGGKLYFEDFQQLERKYQKVWVEVE